MKLQLTQHETQLLKAIGACAQTIGVPAYAVGGFVRDHLIGRATKDIDVVCVGSGIELALEVSKQIKGASKAKTYSRFGTAMVRVGDDEIEFVGARKESYSPDSRKPAVEEGTLEDDQIRRDFTINALAISLAEEDFGEVIDPFNGLADLDAKLIRTPREAGQTFTDDPLRMLRGVRFASQLGFTVHEDTKAAMVRFAERLEIISAERIHVEFNKILLSPKPSIGLALLSETKLLPHFLPELELMHGVEKRGSIGHKDNFWHTLEVVDNLADSSDDLWLTWSALLHDIGKPKTKRFEVKTWTFHGHEVVGAKMVPKIFKRLKLPLDDQMRFVQKMVRFHQKPIALTEEVVTDSALRRLLFDLGDDIDDLLTLCEADITSKNPAKVKKYLKNYKELRRRIKEVEERDQLRNWQPPISGDDIMTTFGIKPGREVGIIKSAIREAILEGEITSERGIARARMIEEGIKLGLTVATG
ncbi:MAG: CCA tRNA nucleotidyltransferase [Saprospiraceae bacterium]